MFSNHQTPNLVFPNLLQEFFSLSSWKRKQTSYRSKTVFILRLPVEKEIIINNYIFVKKIRCLLVWSHELVIISTFNLIWNVKKQVLLEKSRWNLKYSFRTHLIPLQVWQKFIFDFTDVLWLRTKILKRKIAENFFFQNTQFFKKISSVWIYKIMACHIWSYITQLTSLSDGYAFAFF